MVFRKLCGEKTLRNVLIVTNMWSPVATETEEAREAELKSDTDLFKPALDNSATMLRHDNTLESARRIVGHLLASFPVLV